MAKTKQQWSKDEKNVTETQNISLQYLARNKEFNLGYADFKNGVWRKEYETWPINMQWQYERGRAYGAAGGPQIKDGRTTRYAALYFLASLFRDNSLI